MKFIGREEETRTIENILKKKDTRAVLSMVEDVWGKQSLSSIA